jgi:hypothetical protein
MTIMKKNTKEIMGGAIALAIAATFTFLNILPRNPTVDVNIDPSGVHNRAADSDPDPFGVLPVQPAFHQEQILPAPAPLPQPPTPSASQPDGVSPAPAIPKSALVIARAEVSKPPAPQAQTASEPQELIEDAVEDFRATYRRHINTWNH